MTRRTARAAEGELPEGTWLLAGLVAGAGAVAAVPLAAGSLAFVLSSSVGLKARALLALTGASVAVLLVTGPERAFAEYWAAAPAWRLPDALASRGLASWAAAVAPVTFAGVAVTALGLRVWLDLRSPFWSERRKPPSLRNRAAARRQRRRLERGQLRTDGVPLGVDDRGTVVTVAADELSQHALVVGATGSGKTTTVLLLLSGLIPRGFGLVVVDLKGDPKLVATLRRLAASYGREFELWTLEGPAQWNPLARGDATVLMDKLVGLEEWTEPHYKRAAQRYLHLALRVLEQTPERPDIVRVAELLDPEALVVLAHASPAVPPEERERVERYCDGLDRSSRSAIHGLANRIALLAETSPGRYLRGGPASVDLYRTLDDRRIAVFSLDAQKYGETAAHVAALVAQDLKTVASARLAAIGRGETVPPACLALDEFSAMRSDQVLGLLVRGRSAAISVVLSTQELADLARVDPAFAEQVLGNTNLKLIHRQDVPESAERLAGVAGTRTTFEETLQTERSRFVSLGGRRLGGHVGHNTGLGSIREVEHYVVHPNVLKQLPQGTAVLIRKHPRAAVARVRVTPVAPVATAPSSRRRGIGGARRLHAGVRR